ncbi:hypothetical protein KIN20_006954 [Parelaphostrongylus tenuis]|uniref:Uncharacterized protein n=1 Tax=Parelaphostrongylus tenuis TaxID=148309 RepID=A0AAD5M4J7_PARTN|nr:hypothetical protein KIN20_006954 [Parelaphostrongylus tenuis]
MRSQELFGCALIISSAYLCEASFDLFRFACERNATLTFCNAYQFDDSTVPSTSKPSTPLLGVSKSAHDDSGGKDEQLLTWLNEQKDEVPDKKVHSEELEGTHQKPRSRTEYCSKFKVNFGKHCKNGNVNDLNRVLLQFCTSYTRLCERAGDAARDIGEIEDSLEPAGAGSTTQIEDNDHGRDSAKEQEVSQYCEKYWENFNFFCAGQASAAYEKFCQSFRQNCPHKVGSLKESSSFLGGEEKAEDSQGENRPGAGDKLYLYKGTREDYCNKFSVHYEFYCKGSTINTEITAKFCPFFKKSCKDHSERPAEPFTKSISSSKSPSEEGDHGEINFPDVDDHKSSSRRSRRRKHEKKKRPCTADCDQRIFPHCTKACKCDYEYPSVQKFCNPPPLPLFLNTCRLWYAGCPKYEQYHYSSQFIYSRAEKGKKVLLPASPGRFSVVSPTGERIPVGVQQPGSKNIARDDPLGDTVDWARSVDLNPDHFKPSTERSRRIERTSDFHQGHEVRRIRRKGSDGKDSRKRDDPTERRSSRARRAENVPVVASDSVFANALQQYSGLTDSGGGLHRPHSTSPFTKPGLWEANPDNPHNRDHSNKFFYRPESVNVDWLNGQLAWGAHYAVPAVGVGGTDGFSALYFPNAGSFLNIPDDYD